MQAALSTGSAPAVGADDHERRTWAAAVVNGLAMAVLLSGGLVLGSAALLAEGLHMSAHLAALAIGAAAYRVGGGAWAGGDDAARRTINLAGLANALLLMLMAGFLMMESIGDLRHPKAIDLPVAIGLAAFGLAVNLFSLRIFHASRRNYAGAARDLNFRAIYLHMAGDAAVGLISIAGLLSVRFLSWRWADGVAGVLGAALLAVLAVQIVRAVWASRAVAVTDRRPLDPTASPGTLSPAPSCRS